MGNRLTKCKHSNGKVQTLGRQSVGTWAAKRRHLGGKAQAPRRSIARLLPKHTPNRSGHEQDTPPPTLIRTATRQAKHNTSVCPPSPNGIRTRKDNKQPHRTTTTDRQSTLNTASPHCAMTSPTKQDNTAYETRQHHPRNKTTPPTEQDNTTPDTTGKTPFGLPLRSKRLKKKGRFPLQLFGGTKQKAYFCRRKSKTSMHS